MMLPLLLGLVAAPLAWLLTGAVRRYTLQRSILDLPNDRSSHADPTPRGGGLAIAAVCLAGIALLWALGAVAPSVAAALLGGGAMIAAVGWVDDRQSLSRRVRAGVHVAAAAWAVLWLGGLPELRVGGLTLQLGWAGTLLAVCGVVWMVNLYNFMDGIDGIAGVQAVVAGTAGAVFLLAGGHLGLASVALLVAGAGLGFLGWNWSPARIFMGDVGSGLLGFLFAALALASERGGGVPLLVWVVLLGVFVFDATATLLRRVARGERWYEAHCSHAYQRAAHAGWTHREVCRAVAALDVVLAMVAAWMLTGPLRVAAALVALAVLAAAYLVVERTRPMFTGPPVRGGVVRERRAPGGSETIPSSVLRYRKPIIVGIYLVLIPVAYLSAFVLRFDLVVPAEYVALFWTTLPFLFVVRVASFAIFGFHRGWWRHVGVQDLVDLILATTLSSALFLASLFVTGNLRWLPHSILLLDWLLAVAVFGGVRFTVRVVREGRTLRTRRQDGIPALIVGAGDAAERLIRAAARHAGETLRPVGLADDDASKQGMRLHGVPVLGTTRDLADLAARTGARLLVIAIPSAGRDEMQRLVDRCMATGLELKIVPSWRELLDGSARVGQLRSVQIEDLLGREPVELDLTAVRRDLAGKTVLVTGGAGSIGSELARQIAAAGPRQLVLVDQAESGLYFIGQELDRSAPNLETTVVVADVTDEQRVGQVFDTYRPDYVFHAAAYKHVPMMERHVVEAVRTNVFGTLNVARAAARCGAERFILISTDKAVNPSSVMGATKRIAERIVLEWPALQGSGTDLRAVRFGNVLGSDGSVVPLFKRQLEAGGPLTVTHPEVTRYFMTIPEAVQLVLQAGALPEAARRISMLEMGKPVRIVDLAENLLRLSGLEPGRDAHILFTGLRPGEKLHEELMSEVETTVPTTVEKIRVVQTAAPVGEALAAGLDRLGVAIGLGSEQLAREAVCGMVPECVPPLRGHADDEDQQRMLERRRSGG
jgi:FlaA1/EpsC-like NDP-sugar epimerase/UDP-N-acetylmuramyl pentapeptide phosphotransferase/UDP-N-acetylglucosamine-1-phosphate transferase